MSRNGSVQGFINAKPFPAGLGTTTLAATPSIISASTPFSIFWGKFVTPFAMRFFSASLGAYFCTKFEPFQIVKTIVRQNFAKREAALNPFHDNVRFNSSLVSQISSNIGVACNNNFSGHSLISLLLFSSGPTAIIGFIIAVIVFSIQRGTLWPGAHVGEPLGITIFPLFTNTNSSTAVILILFYSRAIATIKHPTPHVIKGGISIFPRHLVSLLAFRAPSYHSGLRESTRAT